MRSCKVVLEDISSICDAEKLKTLTLARDSKTHQSISRRTKEESFLQDLEAKTPIAWGDMKDDRWSELDRAVAGKLHSCNSFRRHDLPGRMQDLWSCANKTTKKPIG